MDAYLIIDTGTSSMRGILYTRDGRLLRAFSFPYRMTLTEDGGAVMEASVFCSALHAAAEAAAKYAAAEKLAIQSLSFTSQRSSVLALSPEGRPLAPILMWYDKRSLEICRSFSPKDLARIHRLSGMMLSPVCSAPKILWLRQNLPSVYHAAGYFIGIHDYLIYLASGVLCTDVTCAGRTCLMNAADKKWSGELLSLFDLPSEKLCPLREPGSIVGKLSGAFAVMTGLPAGIPVITAGGDQQCSSLGLGLRLPGQTGINSGTASYVTALSDTPSASGARGINVNPSALPGLWSLEASSAGTGSIYDWFRGQFYPAAHTDSSSIAEFNRAAASAPAGARGVLCLSTFAGRGCPEWNPRARGVFCNIGLHTQKEDFARALLEGICAEISGCLRALSPLCADTGPLLSSGGLSRFSEFNQILADMAGRPVLVPALSETTSLGALLGTLRALYGAMPEISAQNAGSSSQDGAVKRFFEPRAALHRFYEEQDALRRKIYEKLNAETLYKPK